MEREGTRISPITYIEGHCEKCSEEIYSGFAEVAFAILRSGELLCKPCADLKPDQVLKWFSIAPLPDEPEEEPDLIPEDDRPEKEPEG